jgi:hypothetical protein
MKTSWPQFLRPTRLEDGRSWTAVFESFDQRNDDVYYYITIVEPGCDPSAFFVRVSVPPEGEGSSGPALRALLREDIHRMAESGRANTDYNGSLVGRQAAEWLKARRKQSRSPEPGPAAAEDAPRPKGRFYTSANGRLSFEMEDKPSETIFILLSFLDERFGLKSGFPVFGLDAVYSEGEVEGTKIVVGYDNWSGCFIQAFDEAGDRLVRAMGEALNAGEDARENISAKPASPSPASAPVREEHLAVPAAPAGPGRPEPITAAEFDAALFALGDAAAAVDSSTTCRLVSEEAGYDETPFEADTRSLIRDAILPALKRHPAWLTAARLEMLLSSVLALQPAVQAYRARLLSEAGEYGNEFSPLATAVADLVAVIASALAAKPSLRARLESLPTGVLDASLRSFSVGADGHLESDARTLRERLTLRG